MNNIWVCNRTCNEIVVFLNMKVFVRRAKRVKKWYQEDYEALEAHFHQSCAITIGIFFLNEWTSGLLQSFHYSLKTFQVTNGINSSTTAQRSTMGKEVIVTEQAFINITYVPDVPTNISS